MGYSMGHDHLTLIPRRDCASWSPYGKPECKLNSRTTVSARRLGHDGFFQPVSGKEFRPMFIQGRQAVLTRGADAAKFAPD
jgi:hypothetical protein